MSIHELDLKIAKTMNAAIEDILKGEYPKTPEIIFATGLPNPTRISLIHGGLDTGFYVKTGRLYDVLEQKSEGYADAESLRSVLDQLRSRTRPVSGIGDDFDWKLLEDTSISLGMRLVDGDDFVKYGEWSIRRAMTRPSLDLLLSIEREGSLNG